MFCIQFQTVLENYCDKDIIYIYKLALDICLSVAKCRASSALHYEIRPRPSIDLFHSWFLLEMRSRLSFESDARQAAQVYCLFVLELNIIAAGKTNCTDASVWSAN